MPSKRGEIGFTEGVHEQVQEDSLMVIQVPLPARHPADRRFPAPFQDPVNEIRHIDTFETFFDSSMTTAGKRRFLGPKSLPIFMGIKSTTLVLLFAQLLVFVGTLIGWVFAALALSRSSKPEDPSVGPVNGVNILHDDGSNPSLVFVHVTFAVFALVQVIFIERGIFRARAERYASKHPGEMPPASFQRGRGHVGPNASMPVPPWHRPPLPTYGAALVSSGVGTGDVEDAEIARPPPPAYGKTRGSTLILASYLPDSPRGLQAREYEQDRRISGMSAHSDRPISFISQYGEWETDGDADRARRIEETLAALENDPSRGAPAN